MKKRFFTFIPLLFILSGCFGAMSVEDAIIQYVDEDMKKAYELEEEALTAYENVTGGNYSDDATTLDALENEVIPLYSDFVKEIKKVKVENEELKEIHETYIEGAEKQLEAFEIFLDAIDQQDLSLIQEGNDVLSEGYALIEEYIDSMDALAKEYDIELEFYSNTY